MDGLKVAELKIILKSRGLSCKGNKESLVKRLRDALEVRTSASQSDHIAVQPDDSASQVRSNVSNRSSNCSSANSELKRAEEAADRAELVEKMRSLRDKQYFESKIAELRHGQELLELQSTINELAAREQAFQAYRNNGGISPAPASHPQAHTQYPIQQPPITEADFGHGSQPSLHLPLNERHLKGSRDDIHSELKAERERTAALMRLPPIEIKKFGGDITQFAQFIRSFEMKIASKLEDDSEKLHYLEQNLVSGSKPHTIVASCMYIEDGYEQAMQILRKRYGQPSTIAAAFMDKINDEERMEFGNGEDLDKFALLLMSCKNALGNACHLISDPRTLRNITEKLPSSLLNRWRRRVDDLEETHGRSAVFEDLVEFVMKEARVATNASFGQHMYDGSRGSGKKQINGSFSMVQNQESLVTATQAHSIDYSTCLFCGDKSHYLPECAKLKEMSAEEKKSFVMRNSLCFGCLRRGHRRNLCRRPARCRTCNRSHPTALHEHDGPGNLRGVQPQEQPRAQGETDGAKVTSCRTSTESQKCGAILPIVAVKAKSALGHCTTFAFLDSGSTHSFISTSLVHKLNLGHLPGCQLTLTTVDRAVSVPTQVVAGLSITDLEGENYLSLPALYTLPNLPVEAGQFPKAEDLEEWDHLQDIVLPQPEIAEVGLLLGADAFLAMEPLRVIPSVNGSPYATLTRFGWVICGLNQTASPPDVTTVCRTTVTESKSLEEMIKSFYNYEYAEHLHCTKRGLSAEDRLWMRKVESSIAYERGHVKVLRSDRATNFVGANNELKRELQNQEQNEEWIHYKTLKMGMDWVYNVPGASHHGGVWERQIRTIRRLLESMITSTSMKNETLVTFMCEVEAIINSRPLTPVSTDHLDTEPLSPNHLLLAGAGYDLVPVNLFNKTDSNSRKRWKQAAYYANMFWKRWRAEYLPLLQARPHHLSRAKPNLGVGDIVVVVDESVPRGQWPLGRVLRVKHSADGLVRSVELQVRGTTLQRPVTKIVKLI